MIESDISYYEYPYTTDEKKEDIHKHTKVSGLPYDRLNMYAPEWLFSSYMGHPDESASSFAEDEFLSFLESFEKHSLNLNEKSDLETRLERLESTVKIHTQRIRELTSKNLELSQRIDRLQKANLDHMTLDNSEDDVEFLNKLFELPDSNSNEATGDALSEMKGMLNEYAEEGTDSLRMIRSLRDEE